MRNFVETETHRNLLRRSAGGLVVATFASGAFISTGLFGGFSAAAAEPPKRVTITRHLLPERDPTGTPAVFSYEAINYKPRLEIALGNKEAWDTSTPEKSLVSYLSANWEGDAAKILKIFAPNDREKLQKLVSEKEILEKNTMLFKNITTVIVVQQIFYGNYRILMGLNVTVTGSRRMVHYVLKYTVDGWCMTNDLGEDKIFPKMVEVMKPDPSSIKVEPK